MLLSSEIGLIVDAFVVLEAGAVRVGRRKDDE